MPQIDNDVLTTAYYAVIAQLAEKKKLVEQFPGVVEFADDLAALKKAADQLVRVAHG